MSYPGDRVIFSGRHQPIPVANWQRYNDSNIWMTTIDWEPSVLYVQDKRQPLSKLPNNSWWVTDDGEDTEWDSSEGAINTCAIMAEQLKSIPVEPENLNNLQVYIWTTFGAVQFPFDVREFDKTNGKMSLKKSSQWVRIWTKDSTPALLDGDRYWLQNHVSLIDLPGEWATVDNLNGNHTVYFMPENESDLDSVEDSGEISRLIFIKNTSNCKLEGIELTGALNDGIEIMLSDNITIDRCIFHNNGRYGIFARQSDGITVTRNIVRDNYSCGIVIDAVQNGTIQYNEIAYNAKDGLFIGGNENAVVKYCENITVKQNYIHHHIRWGHPDNMQLFNDVRNVTISENLLMAGGQSIMLEETTNGSIRNNTIIGSGAASIICGNPQVVDYTIEKNTIAFSYHGIFTFSEEKENTTYLDAAENIKIYDNVLSKGNPMSTVFGVGSDVLANDFDTDYNLIYNGNDLNPYSIPLLSYGSHYNESLQSFRDNTGMALNSKASNPLFINAPEYFTIVNQWRIQDCTLDTWILEEWIVDEYGNDAFSVGDMVESNFDGIPREITATNPEEKKITVNPPLDVKPLRCWILVNWKDKTDFSYNLNLSEESPGKDMAQDGGPAGSTINVSDYMNGDFDGDGKRDIPVLPF